MRRLLTLAMALAAAAGPLAAQCAMCRANAAAQSAGAIQALNQGILVLLIPPFAIMGCITWVVWRNRG